jgi:hypothetical protein
MKWCMLMMGMPLWKTPVESPGMSNSAGRRNRLSASLVAGGKGNEDSRCIPFSIVVMVCFVFPPANAAQREIISSPPKALW